MARKMPQNLDAEMSVLGVCFLDDRVVSKVLEEVNEDMFYSDANKKIFLAIKNLHDAGIPIDQTTIADELDKTKSMGAIGGVSYLAEVMDSVVSAANLDYYINIIKEKMIVRNLITTATDIVTEAYNDSDDVTGLLDNAEKNILDVIRSRQTTEFAPINEVLARAQEQLEYLSQNHSVISGRNWFL